MRRGGLPLKVEVVEQIYKLSGDGLSSRAVADRLHTRQGTVLEYLKLGKEKGIEKARMLNEETKPLKISNEYIWKDKLAEDWLRSYAKGGWGGYLAPLMLFCNVAEKMPCELIEEAEQDIKGGKLLRERRYFNYFIMFEQKLKREGYAAAKGYVTSVKAFYQFYEIMELPKNKYRAADASEGVEENNNVRVRKEDIKDMLSVCRYIRDKGIILTIASSGLGSAEVRALTINNFLKGYNEETGITKLYSKRIKTNKHFITFISPECTDTILEYLEHERKIKVWAVNAKGEKRLNIKELEKHRTEPLFAETKKVAAKKDTGIGLGKAGFIRIFKDISRRLERVVVNENRTQNNLIYNELRAHNIRKFFNTSLKNAGAPDFAVEFMMGHKVDSTKAAYYMRNDEELEGIYLKFVGAVTLYPTETQVIQSDEFKELKEDLASRNGRIEELEDKIASWEAKEKERTAASQTLQQEVMTPELEKLLDTRLEELLKKKGLL